MKAQLPDELNNYEINFNGLKNLKEGKYKVCYKFTVNEYIYGKDLIGYIIIKKNENEENQQFKMMKQFRDSYGITKNVIDDEKLNDLLQKYNFNFENTYSGIFS